MKEPSDIKSEAGKQWSNKSHTFREVAEVGTKGKDNNQQQIIFIRGVGFSVHRDGPELYLKNIEK